MKKRRLMDGEALRPGKSNDHFLHGDLTYKILGACYEVSNELGSGFLEAIYHNVEDSGLKCKLNVSNVLTDKESSYPSCTS